MFCSSFLLLIAAVILRSCHVSCLNVSIPIGSPSDSQPLSPTLLSFSIEQDRWPDWTGTDARNNFTYNALSNYAALSGQPPAIRVGADSEDHTLWSPTATLNEDEFPTANSITPYPEATKITVGDAYYALSRYLPHGTHMVWGVNLGANNTTNAVNMASAIARSFDVPAVKAAGIVLDRIEVGNEPDLYVSHGLRPANWTIKNYVSEWNNIAGPVVAALGISGRNGSVTLQGAAFANQKFTPRQLYNLSILESAPGKAISVISQHHYSAHFCKGGNFSLVSFMNKAAIRANLSIFDADIAATQEHGLEYILGETNSIACHGAPGVSNTAGAALWAIDYTLHAATMGIKQAYFHEGVGYKYNFIQPVSLNRSITDGSTLDPPSPPQLLPAYYAGLVVNSLTGSSGASQLVELVVNDTNVSGYAAFEQGTLVRAVFVNMHAWLTSSTGARPSVHLSLTLNGTLNENTTVTAFSQTRAMVARRMVVQHADDVANLTWAGQSFETESALPAGNIVQESVALDDGIDLKASEAVLVEFVMREIAPEPAALASSSKSKSAYIAAGVVSGSAVAAIAVGVAVYVRRRNIKRANDALSFLSDTSLIKETGS